MKSLDLKGRWTLRQAGDKGEIAATVPGDVQSALLQAGRIPNPYVGTNEEKVQWVDKQDWILARTFRVEKAFLEEESVFLTCEGVDTVAEIRLNGKKVGATENMFRRYRFEAKPFLKAGKNEISIHLRAPIAAGAERAKKLPHPIPGGMEGQKASDRSVLRKVQCHFGWDWGIRLIVSGVYGNIALGATSAGRIEYVHTVQKHGKRKCTVEVAVEYEALHGGKQTLEVTLGRETVMKTVKLARGANTVTAGVTIKDPKIWWPAGCGEQPLYDLTVKLGGDETKKRIGLRTVELVSKDDKIGRSFYFRVNGTDVFCKGANWIPLDALPQRHTRERYADLLRSAVAANMNMIRVWGGGQYERDEFYELCDELGLMVWQEFMFACSLYPATPDFLANVREEATHQVKRLRDYACIVLWCGNNENVGALKWSKLARDNRDRYVVEYDRLFEGTIGKVLDECDPTRAYWPSSPSAGRNDYTDCWEEDSRGDMHYWHVWHGDHPFEAYYDVTPRFCSEFGFQSFPSMDAIRTYASPDQFNLTGPVMEFHQRSHIGNTKIIQTFARYFRMPEGFENQVYLSQVQQAVAIKTAVEYWRHLRPVCMGALYWQLNDVWPVCSWASLEYGGKWKPLHYMARRFFAPVLLAAHQTREGLVEVWLTNDTRAPVKAKATLQVMNFAGKVLKKIPLEGRAPKLGAKLQKRFALAELTEDPDNTFLVLRLKHGGTQRNTHFFAPWKRSDLAQARVHATSKKDGEVYRVTVTTDKPAFFVTLNVDGVPGEFDDNCFTLLPREKRELAFTPKSAVPHKTFAAALTVNHLRNTYE